MADCVLESNGDYACACTVGDDEVGSFASASFCEDADAERHDALAVECPFSAAACEFSYPEFVVGGACDVAVECVDGTSERLRCEDGNVGVDDNCDCSGGANDGPFFDPVDFCEKVAAARGGDVAAAADVEEIGTAGCGWTLPE